MGTESSKLSQTLTNVLKLFKTVKPTPHLINTLAVLVMTIT